MKRITGILAATALAVSMAACDSAADSEPPNETVSAVPASIDGMLILESTSWGKGRSSRTVVAELDAVVGGELDDGSARPIMTIDEITDDEITVTLHGWYRTPDGRGEDPSLTLKEGESVSFTTDSNDAGRDFILTYNK